VLLLFLQALRVAAAEAEANRFAAAEAQLQQARAAVEAAEGLAAARQVRPMICGMHTPSERHLTLCSAVTTYPNTLQHSSTADVHQLASYQKQSHLIGAYSMLLNLMCIHSLRAAANAAAAVLPGLRLPAV
jgi:predicted membrane-bound mannosyltransferase